MASTVRCSFTLPPDLVANLEVLSSVMGVSRSAILSGILAGPVADLVGVLDRSGVLVDPDQPDAKARMRGESAEVIRQRLAELDALLEGDLVTAGVRHG